MQKTIFLDKTFLDTTWPVILGFLYQNIFTIIFAMVIFLANEFITIELLFSWGQRLFIFMCLFSSFAVIGFIFSYLARPNPILMPLRPIASLKQIEEQKDKHYKKLEQKFKYGGPSVILFITLFIFFFTYIPTGDLPRATLAAMSISLPFQIGFVTMYAVLIGLELALLFSRYLIHN